MADLYKKTLPIRSFLDRRGAEEFRNVLSEQFERYCPIVKRKEVDGFNFHVHVATVSTDTGKLIDEMRQFSRDLMKNPKSEEKWQLLLGRDVAVVASDEDMAWFEKRDKEGRLTSVLNSHRIGVLDKFVAWLGAEGWHATHFVCRKYIKQWRKYEITPVMLDHEGRAYTAAEWESVLHSDYELVDGDWLFQGEAFKGTVVKVERGKGCI